MSVGGGWQTVTPAAVVIMRERVKKEDDICKASILKVLRGACLPRTDLIGSHGFCQVWYHMMPLKADRPGLCYLCELRLCSTT